MSGKQEARLVPTANELADLAQKVARSQDKAAFAVLFRFYAPRLKSFLMNQNCPPQIAEEITQDVMTTLWRKADLFDHSKSSLGTWLFRIARNRRIDLIRRDKSDRLDPDDPTLFPRTTDIDEEGIDVSERDREIRKALDSLPEEQMMLIRLSFFVGKPHTEIAAELDLPLGTVKSRIRLAFNKLRKTLEANQKVDT